MEQEFIILEDYMTFTPGLNVVRVHGIWPFMEQEFIILEDYMTFTPDLNVVHVSRSLVVLVVFCRSPFVLFFFFCWLLHCLSVFPLFLSY